MGRQQVPVAGGWGSQGGRTGEHGHFQANAVQKKNVKIMFAGINLESVIHVLSHREVNCNWAGSETEPETGRLRNPTSGGEAGRGDAGVLR